MSADGAIVNELYEQLDTAIEKHIRPIKAKNVTARTRKPKKKNKRMFVIFGSRGFTCSVDSEEYDDLMPAHAAELSKAVHVLQRVMTRTEWSSDGTGSDLFEYEREHANVGLEFLSGMLAQMLEASKEALPD